MQHCNVQLCTGCVCLMGRLCLREILIPNRSIIWSWDERGLILKEKGSFLHSKHYKVSWIFCKEIWWLLLSMWYLFRVQISVSPVWYTYSIVRTLSTKKPFYGSVKSIRNRSEKFGLYGSNFLLEKPVSQNVR